MQYQHGSHSKSLLPRSVRGNRQFVQTVQSPQQIPSTQATRKNENRTLLVQPTPIMIRVPHDLRDSPSFIRSEKARRIRDLETNRPSFSSTDFTAYDDVEKRCGVIEGGEAQVVDGCKDVDMDETSSEGSSTASGETSSDDESSSGNEKPDGRNRAHASSGGDDQQNNSKSSTDDHKHTFQNIPSHNSSRSKEHKKKKPKRTEKSSSLKRKLFPHTESKITSAFPGNDISPSTKAKESKTATSSTHAQVQAEPASEHKHKRARRTPQAPPDHSQQTAGSSVPSTTNTAMQKALFAIFADLNHILPPQYITQAQTAIGIKVDPSVTTSSSLNTKIGTATQPSSNRPTLQQPPSPESQLAVLSAARTYIRDISAQTALMVNGPMQTQLTRIATDRETRIKSLEREVERLNGSISSAAANGAGVGAVEKKTGRGRKTKNEP